MCSNASTASLVPCIKTLAADGNSANNQDQLISCCAPVGQPTAVGDAGGAEWRRMCCVVGSSGSSGMPLALAAPGISFASSTSSCCRPGEAGAAGSSMSEAGSDGRSLCFSAAMFELK